VTFRADSFEGVRETIDLNAVIIPKKLAVRLDLLDGNAKTNIEPSRNSAARRS